MNKTTLVIENCEPELSRWLVLEYRHACSIWKDDVILTNMAEPGAGGKLGKIPNLRIVRDSVSSQFSRDEYLLLDPSSDKMLSPDDFENLRALVVGGILGTEKPSGRTKTLIADRCGCETRCLGKYQLSIDGAVFVAKAVSLGMVPEDIEIAGELEIAHDETHSTVLPFGYPVVDGVPIITPGLIKYLSEL